MMVPVNEWRAANGAGHALRHHGPQQTRGKDTMAKKLKIAKATDTPTRKVTRVPPPADIKADAPAPAAKAVKEPKATRNISVDEFELPDGTRRHLRIAEYQDYTLSRNAHERLTDEELIANWQRQFPKAVTFTLHHVRGVRRDYNAGRHSKLFNTKKAGDAISMPYMVKDGKRVPATLENAPAKDAKPVAKDAPAKPATKKVAKHKDAA